jgi:hypothetical protein
VGSELWIRDRLEPIGSSNYKEMYHTYTGDKYNNTKIVVVFRRSIPKIYYSIL